MSQERDNIRHCASFLGVSDGTVAYYPNSESGVAYTYNAQADQWVGDNRVICSKDSGPHSGSGKYYILTAQALGQKTKRENQIYIRISTNTRMAKKAKTD